jgi:hypothetical protein
VLQQVQFRATVPRPNLAGSGTDKFIYFCFEKPNQKSISTTHNSTQTRNIKSK